jgi:hypothetical protein
MDAGFLVFVGILGMNVAGVLILSAITAGGSTATTTGYRDDRPTSAGM